MWAEARKHEKKLKGLMVDYRRRAERRREFYDRIRSDPAAFLQIHGQQMSIQIDPFISQAAESSLMPWMGDSTNMIDRFDVRAHLDHIPDCDSQSLQPMSSNDKTDVTQALERQINYERYRNLVQNEFLGINEGKCLNQIILEERFGVNQCQKEQLNKVQSKKQKLAEKKATIAYNYDNEDANSQTIQQNTKTSDSSETEESSDEEFDFDTSVNIDQLDNESGHRINGIAVKYGMKNDDFIKFLDEDKTEAEKIRIAKELENEKSMFTGRKSRRERRAIKEQRLLILRASNVEDSDRLIPNKDQPIKQNQTSSESEDSVDETKIEFITSFGGSSEDETQKEVFEKKRKQLLAKKKPKAKPIISDKIELTPVVYGPTLPGEDLVSSDNTLTSFNKNSHSRKRSYRYNNSDNDSNKSNRSRSENRHYRRVVGRSHRSRSRSNDLRRSSNRNSNCYQRSSRDRRRSRSRSYDRSKRRASRSRRRSSSRNRSPVRRRSGSRNRRNQRTSSRTRRRSRSSTRSRRKSTSVSKSRKRSRSRNRRRSRSISKSKRKRSRSINRDNKVKEDKKSVSNKKVSSISPNRDQILDNNRNKDSNRKSPSVNKSVKPKTDSIDFTQIEPKIIEEVVQNSIDVKIEAKNDDKEVEPIDKAVKKEVSPQHCQRKSYYRHDLDSDKDSDSDERDRVNSETKSKSGLGLNEGSKKSSTYISNTHGYKSSTSATPQERLKKKMQALIDKQYKLDKKAELEKLSKQQQEKEDREEELREMTSKLKYKQREAFYRGRERHSSSSSRSSSSSY